MKKLLIFIFLFSCSHASEFSDDAYGLHPDKPVVEEIKEYDNSDVAFKIAQEFVPVALGALPYVGHAAHHAAEATKNLYEEIHHKSDLEEASIHAASKTAATLAAESGLKSMLRSAAAPAAEIFAAGAEEALHYGIKHGLTAAGIVAGSNVADVMSQHVDKKLDKLAQDNPDHPDKVPLQELKDDLDTLAMPARVVHKVGEVVGDAAVAGIKAVGKETFPQPEEIYGKKPEAARPQTAEAKPAKLYSETASQTAEAKPAKLFATRPTRTQPAAPAKPKVDTKAADAATDRLNKYDTPEHRKFAEDLKKNLDEMNAHVNEITRAQQKFNASRGKSEQDGASKELALKQEAFVTFRDNMSDLVNGASLAFEASGDKRMAAKVTQFGTGFIMAASGVAVATGAATAASLGVAASSSLFGPAAPISMGVGMMVFAMMSDDDDDSGALQAQLLAIQAAILQVGRALSEQILATHRDTIAHLIELDKRADARTRQLYSQLFNLLMRSEHNQQEIYKILIDLKPYITSNREGVASITNMIMRHHQEMSSQFGALRVEEIEELVEQINKAKAHGLTSEMLETFIRDLHTKIVVKATSASVTGASANPRNFVEIQERLEADSATVSENIYRHPAYSHIALMKQYGELKSGQIRKIAVANPTILIHCAKAIIDLLKFAKQHNIGFESESKRLICLQEVKEVLDYVQNLETVFNDLKDPKLMTTLFDDYIADFSELRKIVDEYKTTYFDDSLCRSVQQRIQEATQRDIHLIESMDPVQNDLLRKQLKDICDAIHNRILMADVILDEEMWHYFRPVRARFKARARGVRTDGKITERPEVEEIKAFVNDYKINHALIDEIVHKENRAQILYRRDLVKQIQERAKQLDLDVKDSIIGFFSTDLRKPLSCLFYPTDPDKRLPILAYPELEVEAKYVREELLGQATLRGEYEIQNDNIISFNLYRIKDGQKELLEQERIAHNLRPEQINYDSMVIWWSGVGRSSEIPDAITIENIGTFAYPLIKDHKSIVASKPLNYENKKRDRLALIRRAAIAPASTEARIKDAIEHDRAILAATPPIKHKELRAQLEMIRDRFCWSRGRAYWKGVRDYNADEITLQRGIVEDKEDLIRLLESEKLLTIADNQDLISAKDAFDKTFTPEYIERRIARKDDLIQRGIPLNSLIYPTSREFPILYFKEELKLDPEYVKFEYEGKGYIELKYEILSHAIEINAYFTPNGSEKFVINRFIVKHNLPIDRITPEAIQAWWFGGPRWAGPDDIVRMHNVGEFLYPRKKSPWTNETRGLKQLENGSAAAQASVALLTDHLGKRKELLKDLNSHVLDDAQMSSETNKLALALRQQDAHYKILESSCALACNEGFSEDCALFKDQAVLRNKEAILRWLRSYKPNLRYTLGSELTVSQDKFTKLKAAMLTTLATRRFGMLTGCANDLQGAMIQINELPLMKPFVDRPIADDQILLLKQDQDQLRSEFREFRSDVATQFATLNESMNSNMGLILRLLQMRGENE